MSFEIIARLQIIQRHHHQGKKKPNPYFSFGVTADAKKKHNIKKHFEGQCPDRKIGSEAGGDITLYGAKHKKITNYISHGRDWHFQYQYNKQSQQYPQNELRIKANHPVYKEFFFRFRFSCLRNINDTT